MVESSCRSILQTTGYLFSIHQIHYISYAAGVFLLQIQYTMDLMFFLVFLYKFFLTFFLMLRHVFAVPQRQQIALQRWIAPRLDGNVGHKRTP